MDAVSVMASDHASGFLSEAVNWYGPAPEHGSAHEKDLQ